MSHPEFPQRAGHDSSYLQFIEPIEADRLIVRILGPPSLVILLGVVPTLAAIFARNEGRCYFDPGLPVSGLRLPFVDQLLRFVSSAVDRL